METNNEQTAAAEKMDSSLYEIGKEYKGYLWIDTDGQVHFRKVRRVKSPNFLRTMVQNELFTIQTNSKLLKVTFSIWRDELTFARVSAIIDKLVMKIMEISRNKNI